jgi:hypothetical protein
VGTTEKAGTCILHENIWLKFPVVKITRFLSCGFKNRASYFLILDGFRQNVAKNKAGKRKQQCAET